MTTYICTRHRRPDCAKWSCRGERRRHAERTTTQADDLANPLSLMHQAVYGGPLYGSGAGWQADDSDCGRSSSGTGSSYDSGSSSYDSGSSSSSDSGGPSGGCD